MDNVDNNLTNNLEESFLDDIKKTDRVICCLGIKGSGKTYFMNSFIKYCLATKMYDTYHLVLPAYKIEQNDSYAYLKDQGVYIYNSFNESVLAIVLKKKPEEKTLLVIDDGTGFGDAFNTPKFKHLLTTSRHLKITTFFCIHASKKCINPIVRMNIDYLFMFNISNMLLLKNLYEEYFGMKINKFNAFISFFNSSMSKKFNAILYSNQTQAIDSDICMWDFVQFSKDIVLQPFKGKLKQIVQAKKPDTKNNIRPSTFNFFRR